MAAKKETPAKKQRSWCVGCCLFYWFICKINAAIWWGLKSELYGVWTDLTVPNITCSSSPRPDNTTGMKYLVAGFAKMATVTMSETLGSLGVNVYHSGDVDTFFWAYQYDLRQMKKFGKLNYNYLPDWNEQTQEWEADRSGFNMVEELTHQDFGRMTSRCPADAMTFDGLEILFWHAYNATPDAKVFVMDWRTHTERLRSGLAFGVQLQFCLLLVGFFFCSVHMLPWGWFLLLTDDLMEWFTGSPGIKKRLAAGHPASIYDLSMWWGLWQATTNVHRIQKHWFTGRGVDHTLTEESFDEFFDNVKKRIPKENRLHVNPKHTTLGEICDFMGMQPCPLPEKSLMPHVQNLFYLERNYPDMTIPRYLFYFFMWLVNWKVFHFVGALLCKAFDFIISVEDQLHAKWGALEAEEK